MQSRRRVEQRYLAYFRTLNRDVGVVEGLGMRADAEGSFEPIARDFQKRRVTASAPQTIEGVRNSARPVVDRRERRVGKAVDAGRPTVSVARDERRELTACPALPPGA